MSETASLTFSQFAKNRVIDPLGRSFRTRKSARPELQGHFVRLRAAGGRLLRQFDPRENQALAVTVVLGASISATSFLVTKHIYDGMASEEFRYQAALYTQVVQNSLQNYATIIHDAAEPFDGAPARMDRWDFFEYAESRLPRYPGLKSLLWVPRVPHNRVNVYELGASNDGLFGFGFTQPARDGSLVPVTDRPEYFPAYYVEPFEGNEKLAGLDLGVDKTLKAAMDKATATGQASVAAPGLWPEATDTERPFVIFEPVYLSKGVPQSAELRAELLAGFIVGVLDIPTIFRAAVTDYTTPAWIDLYLCEVGSGGRDKRVIALLPSQLRAQAGMGPPGKEPVSDRIERAVIELVGQPMSIVVAGVPGKFRSGNMVMPWSIALIGMLLTALLAQYLLSMRRHQRVIGQRMTERTAQLREARELNAALRKEVRRRMRVERQMRDAKTQAEVANRAKSDFLAMVSHELRTPLNAIIGFSEILTDEMFGPIGERRYQGYAGDIRSSAQHLLGLINNILDLTRVESNHYNLEEATVDLTQVINDSVHLLEAKAKAAGLVLEIDCDKRVPMVVGDELALRQILINLLQNAVKFTPAEGHIAVSLQRQQDGDIVVEVRDTGIGIEPEDINRVLEPFMQADTSLARRYEGAGLGLPLSKKLAEMHDGALELQSTPGAGTTVRLVLPASRAANVYRAAI